MRPISVSSDHKIWTLEQWRNDLEQLEQQSEEEIRQYAQEVIQDFEPVLSE